MINILPFNVPMGKFVELKSFKEKIPKYKGWKCSKRFKPFISPTAIQTGKYPNGYYLFVLDFDYKDKWDNPIYKEFKDKYNTYTRESNNGLHMFYFSPVPCDIIECKANINVDLRRLTTIGEANNKKGNYVVWYDLPSNNLPVTVIDCNILIEELYKMNHQQIRHYGDNIIYSKTNKNGNYTLKNPNITPRHIAIALYLKHHNTKYPDWTHGYEYTWKWGLKLGAVLKDELEAEAVATALMNLTNYPKKQAWIVNFVNGFNASYRIGNGLGTIKIKWGVLQLMIQEILDYELDNEELINELSSELRDLNTRQYIEIINEVIK